MKLAVSLDHVWFRYQGDSSWILEDATLQLAMGATVSICGANGAGKSTIIRLLLGCLAPSRGNVSLFGQTVRPVDHLPTVGLISSLSHDDDQGALPNSINVGRLISAYHRMNDLSDDTQAARLLVSLGLDSRQIQRKPVGNLSKGQRQRLIAYFALSKRPQLILADEPLDGLDPISRDVIGEVVQSHVSNEGCALLWISHSPEECLRFANQHLVLAEGRISKRKLKRCDAKVDYSTHSQDFPSCHVELIFSDIAKELSDGRVERAVISFMAIPDQTNAEV